MVRARRVALAALVLPWSVAALALAAAPVAAPLPVAAIRVPAVGWPRSSGLLIAEVVTGGASASDEYVELTNVGATTVDLNGLELAYASAAGTNAIRRAGWATATLLASGRHLLIANAAGTWAGQADTTYTAGIAATGGSLVLRPVGGTPIDAVGWGNATNGFVETVPAPAPPASSSIERRPGGVGGNVIDTNDNAADWSLNSAPAPENFGSPPRPAPGSSPSPRPSATPSPSPRPSATPTPRPSPSLTPGPSSSPVIWPSPSASPSPSPSPTPSRTPGPTPTPSPTPRPSPTQTPSPSPVPTPTRPPSPSPTALPSPTPGATPTPTPMPSPTALPSASPMPSPTAGTISIAEALRRAGQASVAGVVTISPTLLNPGGRLVVIQDATAAIEVRLPLAGSPGSAGLGGHTPVPGARLQVGGLVGRSFGAPRLTASTVTWLGLASQPVPVRLTAAPGPELEWRLVQVSGRLEVLHRFGQRWRAELVLGSARIPIVGLAGSQTSVGRLFVGRSATIIGIVRRAYPSATDQRFAIEPRSMQDLLFGPPDPIRPTPPDWASGPGIGPAGTGSPGPDTQFPPVAPSVAPSVDLRDLAAHRGGRVQVGGLVSAIDRSVISINDATATGRLIVGGEAAAYLDLVEVGDPLEATGLVEVDATGPYLLVTDVDGIVQTGDPGVQATAAAGPAGGSTTQPSPGSGAGSEAFAGRDAGGVPEAAGSPGAVSPAEAIGLVLFGAIVALAVVLPLVRRGHRARSTLGRS